MRFKDTKKLSPVIYGGDVPHKYDMFWYDPIKVPDTEKQFNVFCKLNKFIIDEDWWQTQYDRCINGYYVQGVYEKGGDNFIDGLDTIWENEMDVYVKRLGIHIRNDVLWISGRMYFYLNFWKIKRLNELKTRKIVSNPSFTDLSWENWTIRELMYQKQKDNLWAKSRQRGLSEEEAADTAYDFLFLPDSQSVIVAGEEKYSNNTFNMVKRGLKYIKNTQFYKFTSVNNDELIVSKSIGSEIHKRTAKDNAQAVSSLSPSKVKMEEIGMWQKGLVLETAEFIKSSIEAEGFKTGYITYIGTGGEVEESVNDMEEIFHNPAAHNVLEWDNIYESDDTSGNKIATFIPAWKFEIIDEDGNSLRFRSEKRIMDERNKKSGEQRYRATTQKPLKPSEIFNVSSGGYFGPEIVQLLNERYSYIQNHRNEQLERKGILEFNNPGRPIEGCYFKDDPLGWITIVEEPERDDEGKVYPKLYLAGCDSYDQDEANTSSSKGAFYIKKRFLDNERTYNMYVAQIVERPRTEEGGAETFYQHCAMACLFFGNATVNIEWSNLRIFDWFIRHGFEFLLMPRPQLALANTIISTQVTNRYGTDKSLKPHVLAILKDRLDERFISRMHFRDQIRALAKYRYDPSGKKYNCDITIATGECELADKEYEFVVVKKHRDEQKQRFIRYVMNNGRLIQVIK